jgi:uncharacterized protein (DUF433 family)
VPDVGSDILQTLLIRTAFLTETRCQLTIATINHIDVDERGVARIAGSRIKVIHLVMEKRANGWGPEELQEQFPHLTLAQIHSAFAYFYDHQEQLDQQIDESVRHAEEARQQAGDSAVAKKLRDQGLLK